ncbi:MAG TPA: sigma-54 dependent transcriptional regulator [Polyangiaceae bacterium]|nr:sigma-54 dependent transcriptional regulator [Polyangiaceae bacterium]
MTKHVLIVDDDLELGTVLETELSRRGFRVTLLQSPGDAFARIEKGEDDVDVILTDFQMEGCSGAELCARVVGSGRAIPVVVMTSFGSLDTAIAAIRAGAYDYVTKPFDPDDLALTLDRGVKERGLREEVRRLRLGVDESARFEDMVGSSPDMARAYDLINRVAGTEATVLVTGESGTGKELVAKAIHARSPRANGPFIAINCAAMPEALLESELFGHLKGAFTDAHQSRQGVFLKATGGTLLLDEIGEMPMGMQVKLLRAIQERRVRPVGGDTEVEFDTRIVAATNRNLEHEVSEGRFREDLFYRINVVCVELPPLRARGRDILTLANHLLARCQPNGQRVIGFTSAVVDALLSYSWPGNVRELQNSLERAIALATFDHLRLEDLPERIRRPTPMAAVTEASDPEELITAAELERRYIAHVMATVKGNKTVAARILGLDRRTVYRKLTQPPAAAAGSATVGESAGPPPS